MAEEEQKRQLVIAEDRIKMAHRRKGKVSDPQVKHSKKRGKGE